MKEWMRVSIVTREAQNFKISFLLNFHKKCRKPRPSMLNRAFFFAGMGTRKDCSGLRFGLGNFP